MVLHTPRCTHCSMHCELDARTPIDCVVRVEHMSAVLLQRVLAAAAACNAPAVASTSGRLVGALASRQEWSMPATLQSALHTSPQAAHQHSKDDEGAEKITVTFVEEKTGKEFPVHAPIGKSLLEVAHDNEIELEGACEGSLACSTCHVVVEDEDLFNKLPEATEDELDMLDLAFGLTETSRLGCQVIAAKELEGLRVRIPSATRNMYVDGHVPKPH